MLIKTLPVGQLETNCYVVTNEDTLACVVIDPGDESNYILNYLEDNHLNCEAIFLTHGHYDHVGAVEAIMEETGAPVYLCARDDARNTGDKHYSYLLPEGGRYYDDGDILRFVFTGDTLFRGSCGRTDLPGGSMDEELKSIKRLCDLPGDYEVYPGHMDSSSLERERNFNYYCREAKRRF